MTAKTDIVVCQVSYEDIPTCFQIISRSFGHDAPFFDMYFPHHDTPGGHAQGSQRLIAWKQSSDNSTFLKAVMRDREGGQEHIIGFAVWTFMKEAPPAELVKAENIQEVWPDEADREFMTSLWRSYVIPRTRVVNDANGKGVYVLELLGVHPEYQRLGAGTSLVQWGTCEADKHGVKAVVEGTPVARRLYEKCGLLPQIEEMTFDVGEEFSGRRKPDILFMVREPGS
ncbi:hypothetical protein F4809DRAFT_623952 [Biscogniauxia mediterranea]|nr:hypothetical protein F4809DRAFT_623952 [Biscogniauxia mediterranea]